MNEVSGASGAPDSFNKSIVVDVHHDAELLVAWVAEEFTLGHAVAT